jgi:homoserine dehydrogenase
LRIVLIGFGVVGQNIVKLLLSRNEDLYALYGMKPRIVAVVDSKGSVVSTSGLDLQMLLDAKKTKGTVGGYGDGARKDVVEIIESIDAEVVVEVTPTDLKIGEPGMTNITTAIKNGRNVITANKGPLALALPSLIELAEYNGVMLRFSGTVGGGTPILEFAKRCLKGDRIVSFRGILNGTTNYILTRMEEGLSFDDALNDAKEKGYAEAEPSLDIDGYDAAAKLVIMANWVMGMKVTMKDVNFTGIRNVTADDMKNALKNHNAIKLIAGSNKGLTVKPTEIPKSDPLCVNGTLNAVTFSSEYSGQQTIIGRGAGGMETASAVLRDLIEIREAMGKV